MSDASRLSRALAHRGPDDLGFLGWSPGKETTTGTTADRVSGHSVALIHRRLSILDLTQAGHQPMSSPDGRYHLVYNGEIYNYLELREELERDGATFRSQTDTEVLLAGFARWGVDLLPRLIGMFAFALLDTQERSLTLARDFFGIKPLYYTTSGDRIAFASEIPALLELPGVPRQADPAGVYRYLRFGLTDHSDATLFASIGQLPAAHYIKLSLDPLKPPHPVRYWQLDRTHRESLSFEEAAEKMRELFLENIRLHLRADVPVGVALSGGIDSSAIVAAMRHVGGRDLEIHAFSYIADSPEINEERWIDTVASATGCRLHKVHPTPQQMIRDLDALIGAQGEPFGSTSIYAQHQIFKAAAEQGISVMLDGQGADEMLAGYRPHMATRLSSLLRQGQWGEATRFFRTVSQRPDWLASTLAARAVGQLLPRRMQRIARQAVGRGLTPAWMDGRWFAERQVALEPVWKEGGKELLRDQLHQSILEASLPMLLRYEDRNAMAHSIESRVPFLTPPLVQFALGLPESYWIDEAGTSKAVFRRAMRGLVPDSILERSDKIGFATPEYQWLGAIRPWGDRVLNSDAARQIPALRIERVCHEWDAILASRARFDFRAWRWLNLIRWKECFEVEF